MDWCLPLYLAQPGYVSCRLEPPLTCAEFVSALCPEIWNVDGGRLTHKGKAAIIDEAFESAPGSRVVTPGGTPGGSTPGAATPADSTPAGSGDEARAAETLAGADAALDGTLEFKATKSGPRKMSRKQMKGTSPASPVELH